VRLPSGEAGKDNSPKPLKACGEKQRNRRAAERPNKGMLLGHDSSEGRKVACRRPQRQGEGLATTTEQLQLDGHLQAAAKLLT
jgi:hypothetical protein